jgi:hypothetical protein
MRWLKIDVTDSNQSLPYVFITKFSLENTYLCTEAFCFLFQGLCVRKIR